MKKIALFLTLILSSLLNFAQTQDPVTTPRDKSVLPINPKTGLPGIWPEQKKAIRRGGVE